MEKKDDARKRRMAGAAFTLAMVGCCLLLYFLPQRAQETADAAVAATAEPTMVYPAETVFFDRSKKGGFQAPAGGGEAFALPREGLSEATLTLSLTNGGVRAFTLTVPVVCEPELSGDSEVAVSLYEQRLAEYTLERDWLEPNLFALMDALDIMGALTHADKSGMLSLAQQTMEDGKGRDEEAGGLAFRADTISRADGKYAALSLEIKG